MNETDVHAGRINDQLGNQLESFSAQIEANVERGRNVLSEWKTKAADCTRQTSQEVDRYVHEKPWQSAGIAIAAGLLIGMCWGRR